MPVFHQYLGNCYARVFVSISKALNGSDIKVDYDIRFQYLRSIKNIISYRVRID